GGTGIHPGLVQVCGARRQNGGDAQFRRIRTIQGVAKEIRFHHGKRGCGRASSHRAGEKITGEVRRTTMQPTGILESAKATNPLKQLLNFGRSVWLDYIRRDLFSSGELRRLIEQDGLRGMTSNPSIFEKAINESKFYSDNLKSLLSRTDLDA